MIFRFIYFFTVIFVLGACTGDADKFRQAVIAGNLQITEFSVAPDNRFISAGETLQFTATAKLADGSSRDITADVRWNSSDVSIAAINPSGLLTANKDGVVSVSALFADYSASVQLNVLTANLLGIEIQGATEIDECRGVQFSAIGQYDAGPDRPGLDVDWSVNSDQNIATIGNEAGSKGLLKTTQTGSIIITAAKGSIMQTQTITINDSLSAIALNPASASMQRNDTRQLTAIATYLDASEEDISSIANWSSDNTAVASVDSAGLVTAVATGGVTISAACGGGQGSSAITVTAQASVEAIRINDGEDISVNQNDEPKLTLTAILSNNTSEDVTEDASWSLDDGITSIIFVSNVKGSKGEITINGIGSAQIKATYKGKTARIKITVEP